MNEEQLITYYNKFNEDKRLKTKHARVEYLTAMHYIHECLRQTSGKKILDLGAGTGAYALPLFEEGYDVTAIELVKHNLRTMQMKAPQLDARWGNAMDLSAFADDSFDVILMFGPMYHLISHEDKMTALKEAKRVIKKDGFILISYCMNEYAIITHGIKEGFLKASVQDNQVDETYHVLSAPEDLYSYVRLEDINRLQAEAQLSRYKIIVQDGMAEYLKKEINTMDEETFTFVEMRTFVRFTYTTTSTCARPSQSSSLRRVTLIFAISLLLFCAYICAYMWRNAYICAYISASEHSVAV